MTSTDLVRDDVQPAPEPSPPKTVTGFALIGLLIDVAGIALMIFAVKLLRDYNQGGTVSTIIAVILVLCSLYPLWPTAKGFAGGRERDRQFHAGKLVAARRTAARAREEVMIGMGFGAAVLIIAGLLWIGVGNGAGVATYFFDVDTWWQAFPQMIKGFWINVWVAVVAQILVLIFGLLIAIMRMLPGRAGAPLRLIATVYCDIFRAIPAIVTLYLIVFGLPLAIGFMKDWKLEYLAVVALTLTYSAYVAEVYRAGLASIHPSQTAAARSLGLSYVQTLRKVIVPQGVRRMIPPLLNDFISLQKDTALLSAVGISEVLQTSKYWEAKLFNISPITFAAIFFILITIPQARYLDFLINRDAAKRSGG